MNVPFLDLQAQFRPLQHEMENAIRHVLDTSTYILGPSVEAFEAHFAAYCEAKHCIAVNSGTAALALLLQAHGIGPGDEVITVANTFIATAEAISHVGAVPVFVDCEEDTALIDCSLIAAAITPRTKAIIPVHLYGQCADMDRIKEIAAAHNLLVFEDACQAHGALYKDKKAGSLAHGAAFSFYPGKNLGAYGEAGAITTDDAQIAEKLRMLRNHGSLEKYHHAYIGWNERMDGIQGAVLDVKLPHLDAWNAQRRAHATQYREQLPPAVTTMRERAGSLPAYHLFVVRVPERERAQKALQEKGIATGIHYPVPLHLQKAYAHLGHAAGDFPVSEKLAAEILSLPMFPELTAEQISYVTQSLKEVL